MKKNKSVFAIWATTPSMKDTLSTKDSGLLEK